MADVMVASALGAFPDPGADYYADDPQNATEEEQYDNQDDTEQETGAEYDEGTPEYTEETPECADNNAQGEENNGGDETYGAGETTDGYVEQSGDMGGEGGNETWEKTELGENDPQQDGDETAEEGYENDRGEYSDNPEEQTGDHYAAEAEDVVAETDGSAADSRRIQLVITVEIEEGRADRIEMREGDSARQLAIQFCADHGLDDSVIEPLTGHIQESVAQLEARGGVKQDTYQTTDETAEETAEDTADEPTTEYSDVVEEEKTVTEETKRVTESVSQRSVGSTGHKKRVAGSPDRLTRPTKASAAKGKGSPEIEKPTRPMSAPSYESFERTVYARLFEDSERQHQKLEEEKKKLEQAAQEAIGRQKVKISKKSEAMMRGRTAREYDNYGELLYVEGKIQAEQRRKLAEQKRAEEQRKEVQGLTLRPEISHLAKSLKRPDEVPWNRLAALPTNKQKKLAELKHQLEEAKLAECTFAPALNPKTRKLMAERSEVLRVHHVSHYDQLFQDAERRQVRHKEYSNWYPEDVTFQPNRVTKSRSKSEADSDEEVDVDLFDRLYRSAQKIQDKRDKLKKELELPVDKTTGRKLFNPKIGRPPNFKRKAGNRNVGEYLYSIRHEFEDKKEFMAGRERAAAEEMANKKYVNKASRDLLDRMRARRFQQIFKYLDSDKDGSVDLAEADLEALDVEVKEDIQEATRLAGENAVAGFERFSELMATVLNGRKTGPRKYLLPDSHRPGDSNRDMTFAYKMGKKSREMAERRRRSDLTPEQWYQMQLVERKRISERVEKLKQQKLEQEMAECTFRPGINASAAEGRLKAMLARPKTDGKHRSAEERIASLERELRDVHGFILGTNAPGKDAPAWAPEPEPFSIPKALAATDKSRSGSVTSAQKPPQSSVTSAQRNSVTSLSKQQRSSVTSAQKQERSSMTSLSKQEDPLDESETDSEEETDSEDEREKARDMRSRIQAMGGRAKSAEDQLPDVLRAVKRTVPDREGSERESDEESESESDDDEESDDEEKEHVSKPVGRATVVKTSYSERVVESDSDESESGSDDNEEDA